MGLEARTPEVVMAGLAVALAAAAVLLGGAERAPDPRDAAREVAAHELAARKIAARTGAISRRVERIRGQRFRAPVTAHAVSADQARRESLADLDARYSPEERRADETVLKLLGLLRAGDDIRQINAMLSAEAVIGYYDPHRDRLSLVEDAIGSSLTAADTTLAHELTHALDDQRFRLREPREGADDRAAAYLALVEGVATGVQFEYAERHSEGGAAGSLLTGPDVDPSVIARIPPYVLHSLEFSYLGGKRFVDRLYRAGDGWKLVDYAYRVRLPESTEQILHPDRYLAGERPVAVTPRARTVLGPEWSLVRRGTLGEFDAGELLRMGLDTPEAGRAAAGWAGGRYELWQSRAAERCPGPCPRYSALVLGLAWDSAAEAREFDRALPAYLEDGLDARKRSSGSWSRRDGMIAAVRRGTRTALAFAPDEETARRLAAATAPPGRSQAP